MPPTPDDLADWLRLLATPGVGRAAARQLLAAFGSPAGVLSASRAGLQAVVGPDIAAALAVAPEGFAASLDAADRWLGDAAAPAPRGIVCLGDPTYPQRLLETADPPLLLYAQGDVGLLASDAVAVVGSRHPTPQGQETARALATALGEQGLTVVSGLALGIDAAAHEGALAAAAPTIAVVGTGIDRVYPARHRPLALRIVERGLIVSEFPLGTMPLAGNFPQRNRIIAGLALGTLVVEAAPASGSMITARLAAEAGREVFAVPGSIHALQSRGCHALIRQGALLVETAAEILAELRRPAGKPRMATRGTLVGTDAVLDGEALDTTPADEAATAAGLPPGTDPALIAALGHGPVSLDALAARTGLGAHVLGAALLELELAGHVARLPGLLFQRIGLA